MAEPQVLGFKPLYAQVKDALMQRLIDGRWQPGQMIPSETELAREIGVSQGTVRKALDDMTAENLLVRRQGRGTYIAEPEDGRMMFQFFRLFPDTGARSFPESRILARASGPATAREIQDLDLKKGDMVHRFERLRFIGAMPLLVETVVLPDARFAGFGRQTDLPNNVYQLYSRNWGITIARASETLKAIAANVRDGKALKVASGTPLLSIHRIAFDLANRPVELRVSRCLTVKAHYAAELR